MRKVFTIIVGFFLTFLFTTCKQFTANIDDYLSYWAAEVSPMDYSIDKLQQTSADGSMCVPSADNLTVTVKLNNPKNFTLITPTSTADAGKIISFPGLSTQPLYGTDYMLEQKSSDTLTLEYKSAFLRTHEWSNGDIGPEITLTADDGRVFKKKFSINLKVNTAPVLENAGIAKTEVGSEWYYVLLFRVKDMDSTITDSSVHRDLKTLNITAGDVPAEIPLSFNSSSTDFATSKNLLATANDIDSGSPITHENWILRLKTDVKVGGPAKEYTVSVKDAQGLSSAVIQASTQKIKLAAVELLDGLSPITETTESAPASFPGISGKTLTAQVHSGATVTGIAYKHSGADWNQAFIISGTTPVSINLPALDSGEDEAFYKITLKAQLTGYDDSDEQTFFVKLLRQEVPVLKLKQDFAGTDTALHSISAAAKGYVSEDIISDARLYTNANPLVIYNQGGTAKLSLTVSAGATVKYKLNNGSEMTTSGEIAIAAGTNEFEVWAEKGGVSGPHTVLYVSVKDSLTAYSELKNTVQNAPNNGSMAPAYGYSSPITIKIGADLTAFGNTEIAVTDGKKLTIQSDTSGSSRTIDVSGHGRIFNISGGAELSLDQIELKNGNADKGGAVYVENGTLTLSGKTVITPSGGADANAPGKNDVYLKNGNTIKLTGPLTAAGTVARITPEIYSESTQVLGGTSTLLSSEHGKFTVTQPDDGFLWKIKDNGRLQAIPNTVNNSDGKAWKKLLDAVRDLPDGSTITISGIVQATNDAGNSGEIIIEKNLTIKGKTGAASDILDANSSGTNHPATTHRIFKVENGKTLTLENLTLKNGKVTATDDQGRGGAIYAKGATVNITNCTFTGNEAHEGYGGAIAASGATVAITNCTFTGNQATRDGGAVFATKDNGGTASTVTINGGSIGSNTVIMEWACGGGIFVAEGSTLTLDEYTDGSGTKHGVQITGNKAGRAGGVRANDSTVTMTGCTITDNQATGDSGGGGVYITGSKLDMTSCTLTGNTTPDRKPGGGLNIEKGEVTMTNCTLTGNTAGSSGGGIYTTYIDSTPSTVTIKGCTIKNNSATRYNGGGIYIGERCTVTLEDNGTTGCTVQGNWARYNGRGVFVEKPPATFTMKGGTKIDQDNDVFLRADSSGSAKITVDSSLSPAGGIAARITPESYNMTTQVLAGSITDGTPQNYTKFTVTPQTLSDGKILYWEADADGKLMRIVDGVKYPNKAWKALKDVVSVAGSDPITINGIIQATDDADNQGPININDNITIKGKNGRDTDILDAGKKGGRIFSIPDGSNNKLNLEKLTLKGGSVNGNDGAAIIVGRDAEAELSACTIEECEALNGGAIAIWSNGKATLTNTDIKNCSAKLFYGNPPPNGSGGAIYAAGGTVIMTNCTLTGNTAENNGGAVYAKKEDSTPSTVTISGGAIGKKEDGDAGNTAQSYGGGIWVGEGCTLTMKNDAKVVGNKTNARSGGGIYAEGAVVNITNCTLKGNSTPMSSEAFGGAIYAKKIGTTPSTVTISGGFIGKKEDGDDGNKAKNGGGIWVGEGSILTLNEYTDGSGAKHGVQLIGNQSNSYGGGVCAEGAAVNITNCTFKGNTSSVGGAICAYKHDGSPQSVTISGGAIGGTDNDKNEARRGGGIYVGKGYELTLEGSVQITGNNAKAGSGVYVRNSSTIFRMKESAKVNTNNDVYLAAEAGGNVAMITVDGTLTNNPAARITVPDDKYDSNTQVLTGSAISSNYTKFAVTPKGTTSWYVGSNGRLTTVKP
ncbi:right-handed parallel beta-helix repeat-containing protein [Treponema vincentii]|uniref:right-handed parallel beta-helix repeat-containing protein n=1 Tax=Treponema vincentii TaxID=69710 RepID=UPI0020A3FFFE|nr:right-handed parallel beta-helix repeat-containing protein [Treponema vincentii]UTC48990.1 right-handed parallel beta-helix repeat-containing protein [Treponema vincentii]